MWDDVSRWRRGWRSLTTRHACERESVCVFLSTPMISFSRVLFPKIARSVTRRPAPLLRYLPSSSRYLLVLLPLWVGPRLGPLAFPPRDLGPWCRRCPVLSCMRACVYVCVGGNGRTEAASERRARCGMRRQAIRVLTAALQLPCSDHTHTQSFSSWGWWWPTLARVVVWLIRVCGCRACLLSADRVGEREQGRHGRG